MLGGETIPKDIAAILKDAANCSLAYKTWAGAKTVIRLISRCEKETGVSLQLPWSNPFMSQNPPREYLVFGRIHYEF